VPDDIPADTDEGSGDDRSSGGDGADVDGRIGVIDGIDVAIDAGGTRPGPVAGDADGDDHPGDGPGTGAAAGAEAAQAATDAAVETLLNCYLRESEAWRIEGERLVVPIRGGGATVVADLAHRSRTFRHRYHLPAHLAIGDGEPRPVGFPALAGLLLEELTPLRDDAPAPRPVTLLARMVESVQNVTGFLAARAGDVDRLWSAEPLGFVESEQALLLGHPLHPTPKSRTEMSPADRRAYSPELQATFPLRWLAARPEVVRHASATGTPAPELVADLLRADPATDVARLDAQLAGLGDRVLLPAHPWELDHLRRQDEVASLFCRGDLVDLGPHGSPVTPTTSVRTVYQAGWPWQMKFSLHVAVTNSLRVTLPKELDRAVEAYTYRRSRLGEAAAVLAPNFVYVDDPAYLTVAVDGRVLDGFSVLLRQNRWPTGSSADVTAVTTLCQDHPFAGPTRSRLAAVVARLAERRGIPLEEAGRAWFARFCEVAVVSLVRLYLDAGLCFEPHQQNTLLELDDDGLPRRCAYRDSQGYFHRELAHDDVVRVLPGLGEATESIFPEALADERLVYYPFMNLTLGVVNALGASGSADEGVLLGDLRRCLLAERARGGRYPATLLDRLLDDERWPCKANLRTRLHDMDELVGDIADQSVYVTVPNPIAEVATTSPIDDVEVMA
jgi:siderophore synthetase component